MKNKNNSNNKNKQENKKPDASALKAKTEMVNGLGASAEFTDVD